MDKEFVTYKQSLALKELGFDEPCFGFYIASQLFVTSDSVYNSSDIPVCKAPLYQQAFKWFREKHGLYTEIFVDDDKTFGFLISSFIEEGRVDKPIHRGFSTYEESEQACLEKLIKIVKNK